MTCQFDDLQVSLLQRMSGLTGHTAATQISDERRLWAGSVRRRDRRPLGNHARFPVNSEPSHAVLPKVRLGRKCLAFGSELLGMAH